MGAWRRLLLGAVTAAATLGAHANTTGDVTAATGGQTAASTSQPSSQWIESWTASPSDTRPLPFVSQAIRELITPHTRGTRLRVRLTNRFGRSPVTFSHVYVGRHRTGGGASVVKGTNTALTFDGSRQVTIPAGQEILSDPIAFTVKPFHELAVSLQVVGVHGQATRHPTSPRVSYVSVVGEHAADTSGQKFLTGTLSPQKAWYYLDGLQVQGADVNRTVVTFGDSITEGYKSKQGLLSFLKPPFSADNHTRYPGFLQRRLLKEADAPAVNVVNAGINGNRLLRDGRGQFGPSGLSRLQHDILDLPNVSTVIVLEGFNDIGLVPKPTAAELTDGLATLVHRLQANGLKVVLGTLTPSRGARFGYGTRRADRLRHQVNDWIRTQSLADSVVDFDACLRDPNRPSYLRPDYASNDHLHPNADGYRAMAQCVDLSTLR